MVPGKRDAVQLHAVIDQAEAELLGDPALERLQLLVDELEDVAGLDVDEMVVMGLRRSLVTGAAVAEIVPLQYAGLFEQADGAVDGGDRDAGIDGGGAAVEGLDAGWSSESPRTRAITLRCSVMRRPFSAQSASISMLRS